MAAKQTDEGKTNFQEVYMNDTELENRIKKSAEDIEIKDFSARYANICEIAGKGAAEEHTVILAEQPVTQTTSGSTGGRRGTKIAVISAICAAVIVLAAVLIVMLPSYAQDNASMSEAPSENAVSSENYVQGGSAQTYDEDANSVVISSISADQSTFYAVFESAQLTIADFTVYDSVSYYLYYSESSLAGGKVLFNYKNYNVETEFYLEEYILFFRLAEYQSDGIYYLFNDNLPEEIVQEIADILF